MIDMRWRSLLKVQDQSFMLGMMLFWSWPAFDIQPVFSGYCCVVDSVSILYRRLLLDIGATLYHLFASRSFIKLLYLLVCIYVCMYVYHPSPSCPSAGASEHEHTSVPWQILLYNPAYREPSKRSSTSMAQQFLMIYTWPRRLRRISSSMNDKIRSVKNKTVNFGELITTVDNNNSN